MDIIIFFVYQIDQSGKIEQTSKDSVLGRANRNNKTILIPRQLKRKIIKVFRAHEINKLYAYFLFSVGIFYLIKDLRKSEKLIIDVEYFSKDKIILAFIEDLLIKFNKPFHDIQIARIGNRPEVHYLAKDVYNGRERPDLILSESDVVEALKKTDGRLRECLSTLAGAQPRPSKSILTKKAKKVNAKIYS